MNIAARKLSTRARTGQSVSRVLAIGASFAALLASAAMVGSRLIAPEQPSPADRYQGVVQLAPDERGRCERLAFDNRTGSMRREGATWCDDSMPAAATGSSERFSNVRDYFRGH